MALKQAVGLLGLPARTSSALFAPHQQCWRPELEDELGPCLVRWRRSDTGPQPLSPTLTLTLTLTPTSTATLTPP